MAQWREIMERLKTDDEGTLEYLKSLNVEPNVFTSP